MKNMLDINAGYVLLTMIVFLSLSFVYSKNAIHMFQQNRYEFLRYTKWLFNIKNYHFLLPIIYIVVTICLDVFAKSYSTILILLFTVGFSIFLIRKEEQKEYIKPLVYTARVKRQIAVYFVLLVIMNLLFVYYLPNSIQGALCIITPYLLIYLVGLITLPFENAIKNKYENQAKSILKQDDDLIKIGITGSYGKTSTKNIIKDIIGDSYYTLITPASYNTPMGITRTIKELYKPIYQVFVCEMGADHVGEITHLMKFVEPKYGVVTSIGPQHLNTFGNINNIINEKMQEIELLPKDGVGIINIDNEYINNYQIKNKCKIVSVGIKNKKANYVASDIKYTKEGSSFSVTINRRKTKFKTCLLGEHNIMNILCGIALSLELGIDKKQIVKAVNNISQIEHRLEVKEINGYTFIDNAFNSNPVGCKYSLDVLKMMPKKRIIVTPGLIDLGKIENKENYEFGKYMKDKADFVILVGEKNSEYIKKGLIESKFNEKNIVVVNSEKEAFNYIYSNFSKKDTILLENDLPDAFLH